MSTDKIIAISKENLDLILPLIRAYQTFYQVTSMCDVKNKEFFSQFGPDNPMGCQFAYVRGQQCIGFATVYFTFSSSSTCKIGVMNDLYTDESHRKTGVATALIEHCRTFVGEHGGARLQWVTAQDNFAAQHVYDQLDTKRSSWHIYAYPIE